VPAGTTDAGGAVFATGDDGSMALLLALAAGVLGLTLSPVAEILIAKLLPRLGSLPALPIRIMTAALTGLACAAFSWNKPCPPRFHIPGRAGCTARPD
jgi:leader peptidase (prepilin peptidase)/N-methyltransferase